MQAGIGEAAEDLAQPEHELIDLHRPQRGEVVGIDLAHGHLGQPGGDQLHGPLEQLRGALDADVIAVVECLVDYVRGVPHPRADLARTVGKLHLQIEVAVAVGPKLLFGNDKDLVDGLLMTELIHIAARHEKSFRGGETNDAKPAILPAAALLHKGEALSHTKCECS